MREAWKVSRSAARGCAIVQDDSTSEIGIQRDEVAVFCIWGVGEVQQEDWERGGRYLKTCECQELVAGQSIFAD
jgi:hypothetical protein